MIAEPLPEMDAEMWQAGIQAVVVGLRRHAAGVADGGGMGGGGAPLPHRERARRRAGRGGAVVGRGGAGVRAGRRRRPGRARLRRGAVARPERAGGVARARPSGRGPRRVRRRARAVGAHGHRGGSRRRSRLLRRAVGRMDAGARRQAAADCAAGDSRRAGARPRAGRGGAAGGRAGRSRRSPRRSRSGHGRRAGGGVARTCRPAAARRRAIGPARLPSGPTPRSWIRTRRRRCAARLRDAARADDRAALALLDEHRVGPGRDAVDGARALERGAGEPQRRQASARRCCARGSRRSRRRRRAIASTRRRPRARRWMPRAWNACARGSRAPPGSRS